MLVNHLEKRESSNKIGLLKKLELFNNLSDHELKILTNNYYQLNFKKGELVFKQGTPCTHILIIIDGLANLYLESDNRNTSIKFLKSNDIVLCSGMFVDSRHHYSVRAIDTTRICFIEVNNIKKLLRLNIQFAEKYMAEINKNINFAYNKISSFNKRGCEFKIAEILIFLHSHFDKNSNNEIQISKTELAEYTDIPKNSVKRVISQFVKDEIVLNTGSCIKIVKSNKLKRMISTF